MNDGWVKFYRKTGKNNIFRHDLTAWHVFEVLMLYCDRETGKWEGGRFMLAELCDLKPTTTYKALKRLEKAKMVTLSSNNKYTTIYICNWKIYQGDGNNSSNNQVTTKGQQSNTYTRIKNKELINKTSSDKNLEEEVVRQVDYIIKLRKASGFDKGRQSVAQERQIAHRLIKKYGYKELYDTIKNYADYKENQSQEPFPAVLTLKDFEDYWAAVGKRIDDAGWM